MFRAALNVATGQMEWHVVAAKDGHRGDADEEKEDENENEDFADAFAASDYADMLHDAERVRPQAAAARPRAAKPRPHRQYASGRSASCMSKRRGSRGGMLLLRLVMVVLSSLSIATIAARPSR